jgi:hypothetical protein
MGYSSKVVSFTIPRTRDGKVISTFTTLEGKPKNAVIY